MKKFFVAVAIALPFVISSCSDDNEDPISLASSSITLNVAEYAELTASDNGGTWTSSNEFVATVDKNGKVTAAHVGEAEITVSKNGSSATCKVVVNPVYTDYNFPYMTWGASVADIKGYVASDNVLTLLDETIETEDNINWTYLSYTTAGELPGYIYAFANDALYASSIVVDINETNKFDNFLYQYFADYEEDEEWYYLINGTSVENSSVAAQYGLNDETSIIATFMPIDGTRASDIKGMFNTLKINKTIFKNIK